MHYCIVISLYINEFNDIYFKISEYSSLSGTFLQVLSRFSINSMFLHIYVPSLSI